MLSLNKTFYVRNYLKLSYLGCLLLLISCSKKNVKTYKKTQSKQPNIIYILADDLGYGDIGIYGQKKIETPHLDALASNGIRFTQHYAGASVCAPSRSTLMTGQHTGNTPIRGNKDATQGQIPLPAKSITIAELLKQKGYTTGVFGKWGLGFNEGDPNNQGFDEFYGYNDQKLAHRYYPPYLNYNQTLDSLAGNDWKNTETYAPEIIQQKTLEFIEKNSKHPFFAYVPMVLPHAELISPKDSIFQLYNGKFLEKPHTVDNRYTSDYGENIIPYQYCSQSHPYATYATMVTRMDAYVGQIVKKVQELGIAENTIIMFASDNGPHKEGGANPSFFNSSGGLRGVKRDLYEGGIRSPFIAVWPEKIKPNLVSHHVSAFWDVMPTIAEITNTKITHKIDGISFLPTLLNDIKNQKQHDYLYWEFNFRKGRKAIRQRKWKGVWYQINAKNERFELYDLEKDITEQNNLIKLYPQKVEELKQLMLKTHTSSSIFPFD